MLFIKKKNKGKLKRNPHKKSNKENHNNQDETKIYTYKECEKCYFDSKLSSILPPFGSDSFFLVTLLVVTQHFSFVSTLFNFSFTQQIPIQTLENINKKRKKKMGTKIKIK